MNVLFVTSEVFNKTGGGMLARAYVETLRKMEGVNAYPFIFPKRGLKEEENFDGWIVNEAFSSVQKVFNVFSRTHALIGKKAEEDFVEVINKYKIDIVFLFRAVESRFMQIVHERNLNVKVVALYIDIYPDVYKLRKKNLRDFLSHYPIYKQRLKIQKYCTENADGTIVLNDREKAAFEKNYGKSPDLILPIISKDLFDENRVGVERQNGEKSSNNLELLFMGSYFSPNINGIKWFVENVMPHVPDNVTLKIVGNKMEQLRDDALFADSRIEVVGTVDDITGYYYKADVIIAPIFEGTGMKTKTAEALMFGKQMLASEEALCGYETVSGFLCKDAEEFISKIKQFEEHRPKKFNKNLRQIYLTQYSENAIADSLKKLFHSICTK